MRLRAVSRGAALREGRGPKARRLRAVSRARAEGLTTPRLKPRVTWARRGLRFERGGVRQPGACGR